MRGVDYSFPLLVGSEINIGLSTYGTDEELAEGRVR
jgi:hypothetical protein